MLCYSEAQISIYNYDELGSGYVIEVSTNNYVH